MKRLKIYLCLQMALLAALSAVCGYAFTRPGYVVDFEIATMLTPLGILRELGFDGRLARFYDRVPERAGLFDMPSIGLLVVAAVLASLWALQRLKRRRLAGVRR